MRDGTRGLEQGLGKLWAKYTIEVGDSIAATAEATVKRPATGPVDTPSTIVCALRQAEAAEGRGLEKAMLQHEQREATLKQHTMQARQQRFWGRVDHMLREAALAEAEAELARGERYASIEASCLQPLAACSSELRSWLVTSGDERDAETRRLQLQHADEEGDQLWSIFCSRVEVETPGLVVTPLSREQVGNIDAVVQSQLAGGAASLHAAAMNGGVFRVSRAAAFTPARPHASATGNASSGGGGGGGSGGGSGSVGTPRRGLAGLVCSELCLTRADLQTVLRALVASTGPSPPCAFHPAHAPTRPAPSAQRALRVWVAVARVHRFGPRLALVLHSHAVAADPRSRRLPSSGPRRSPTSATLPLSPLNRGRRERERPDRSHAAQDHASHQGGGGRGGGGAIRNAASPMKMVSGGQLKGAAAAVGRNESRAAAVPAKRPLFPINMPLSASLVSWLQPTSRPSGDDGVYYLAEEYRPVGVTRADDASGAPIVRAGLAAAQFLADGGAKRLAALPSMVAREYGASGLLAFAPPEQAPSSAASTAAPAVGGGSEAECGVALQLRPASVEHLLGVGLVLERLQPDDMEAFGGVYAPRFPPAARLASLYVRCPPTLPPAASPAGVEADADTSVATADGGSSVATADGGCSLRVRPLSPPELEELARVYISRSIAAPTATLALPVTPAAERKAPTKAAKAAKAKAPRERPVLDERLVHMCFAASTQQPC